jgi:small GTP-binding protein
VTGSRNIALLLTPPHPAAIAVVRLIGPGVESFLAKHFSKPLPIGRCVHGTLSAGDQVIDDPLIVRQADHADVNLHGGPWIVRSFLDLADKHGFEVWDQLTTPLPLESVEGTTELEKAVFAVLPLAGTPLALQRLLEQPKSWKALRNTNPDLRAMANDSELWWLLHPPRVALVGIANVGKSTLANQLFGQQRSITADLPGTTRDWVGDIADIDGLAVHLIDTPGIRDTDDPIECEATAQAKFQLERADLIVVVLDATVPLGEQEHLLGRYPGALRIINKSDRSLMDLPGGIRTVATTGIGVDRVSEAICRHFYIGRRPGEAKWWTQEQRELLLSGVLPSLCGD